MNTDKPLSPPFPVGTSVKYIGKRQWWRALKDGSKAVCCEPGMVVSIVEVVEGRQGTGQFVTEDDYGHEICDETENGYSIYDAGKGGQWIIWPEDAGKWGVVE